MASDNEYKSTIDLGDVIVADETILILRDEWRDRDSGELLETSDWAITRSEFGKRAGEPAPYKVIDTDCAGAILEVEGFTSRYLWIREEDEEAS